MADIVYGLTEAGLAVKPLTVVRNDMSDRVRAAFGDSFDVSDFSIAGQLLAIIAEALYLLWELTEAVNSSSDPNKASGAALEAICALTGTVRPPATHSTVVVTLTGTGGTNVVAGTLVETASTQSQFALDDLITLSSLPAWVPSTPYLRGARVFNTARCYQCLTAGTSAASGGPITAVPGANITDGTTVWLYIGEGSAVGDGTATATVTGPVQAYALDLNVKVGATDGWMSVYNLLDADPGSNEGTDEQLRELRIAELAGNGKSTQAAIKADLLGLDTVTAVTVFVNNTDFVNTDGMPPHSVEALIQGGNDDAIRTVLFGAVAAGIATTGTVTGTVTDTEGTVHEVDFSRPTVIPIYIVMTLTYDALLYSSDELVKDAIVAFGDAQPSGKDVVSSSLLAQAFKVDGVLDVASCYIGVAPGPGTSTTIPITLRQLATFDTSRITIVSTPAVP